RLGAPELLGPAARSDPEVARRPGALEVDLEVRVEHHAVAAHDVREAQRAHRRVVEHDHLVVPADGLVLPQEPAPAHARVPWIAPLAEYLRTSQVEFERARDGHAGR